MSDILNRIKLLFNELESNKILKTLEKGDKFHDEPSFLQYNALLDSIEKYSDGVKYEFSTASGISFNSRHLAMLKCLSEAAERFCLISYLDSSIINSKYKDLKEPALDPSILDGNGIYRKKKIGWIKGFNLSENKKTLIPAQLIYMNYKIGRGITILPHPLMSTGAAGGFEHESTLLRAIYEVVERDAFMTSYLNRIKSPRIKLEGIRNKVIQSILDNCGRYKLKLFTFDITNDLGIPSFLTLLIDKTGLGPAVSCGAKSSMRQEEALVGSIVESFLTRPWIRGVMLKNKLRFSKIYPYDINSHLARALYWVSPTMLKHLSFWLNQRPTRLNSFAFSGNSQEELSKVKELFLRKNFEIFYADITLDMFRKLGYLVYKAVVPNLHPLYLNEKYRTIRIPRLKEVSAFFGKNKFSINKVSHPFL